MINKNIILIAGLVILSPKNICAKIEEERLNQIKHPAVVFNHDADQAENEKATQKRVLLEKNIKFVISEPSSEEKILFEESFAQASPDIKRLVYGMLKKESWAMRFKSLLFTGPTGSGKTTLVQAFVYKLNKKCLLVHAPTLLGHFQNQAVENIRDLFEHLNSYKEKPVLVMDEMNVLTDNYTSEHSDKKDTAAEFWTCLDKLKNDKDFIFYGTCNVTKKLPHPVMSRFQGKTVTIDSPSIEARKRSIRFCIKQLGTEIDATCDDKYFEELSAKTANFSLRAIESLIDLAQWLFATENPNSLIKLSKKHLEQAYINIKKEDEKYWDWSDPATAEDRRHKESQDLQIKLAEWNMLYQSLMKPHERGPFRTSWQTGVEITNKLKTLIFPEKKSAGKIDPGWIKDSLKRNEDESEN